MIGVVGVLILLGTGWVIGRYVFINTQSASAQANQEKELIATPENLLYLGLNFKEMNMDDSQRTRLITKDQALTIAYEGEPNLKKIVRFSTRLGMIQSDTQEILRLVRPVWLITFHGIESVSLGPKEAAHYTSEEYTVVIDAQKGEFLLGFPLFDVTPQVLPNSPTIVPDKLITPTPMIGNPEIPPTATP